jgi:Flp pilus assembly protein TadG
MAMNSLLVKLLNRLQAFRSARGGNMVITFSLAIVPIVGAVGAAVDYSRANSAKTDMQAALDSTALKLAKDGAATLSSTDMQSSATSYFNAIFHRPEAQNVTVTPTVSGSTLTVSGSATINTTVLGVLGFNMLNISASSTVSWGANKLEIALVLDNTGSMLENGKMPALISASHQLLASLQKAAQNPGDIKVAIIPFTTEVNIGTAYKTKPWIDWSYMNSSGGCGDQCGWDQEEENGNITSWTGGVVDRAQPYDVQDTTPTTDKATWYPAVNSSIASIQPLTSDWTALNAKIDKMVARGRTNLTIGLVWGWHALTPNEPLTEATAPSSTVSKYIVFLTDGLNTMNRWTTNSSQIDARTTLVCDNIKAAGIKLYTIRVMLGNKALLQSCATNPSMYYEVNQSSQMAPVFASIVQDLTKLRISR